MYVWGVGVGGCCHQQLLFYLCLLQGLMNITGNVTDRRGKLIALAFYSVFMITFNN